jgi:RNAse (barnase) inhibitor barstar
MNLNFKEIYLKETPSIFLVYSRERDVDIFFTKASHIKAVTRIIRGRSCQTSKDLFHEFSSALQFPYYFGENWDAFDECINDLSWLNTHNIVIVITNAGILLQKEEERELRKLLQIFNDTIAYWKKTGFFKIVYQTDKEVNTKIKEIASLRILERMDDIQ